MFFLYNFQAVLNEKAEREYNSKLFYKKQWTRAIRELHFKKMENHPASKEDMCPRHDIDE